MMEKLRMFFINKTHNKKERHAYMRGNTKKALRRGSLPSPGERFHQA
jgi:hypothetical protein